MEDRLFFSPVIPSSGRRTDQNHFSLAADRQFFEFVWKEEIFSLLQTYSAQIQ